MKWFILMTAGIIMAVCFTGIPAGDTLTLDQWKQALSVNDEYLHGLQVLDKNVKENAKVLIHNIETKKSANYEMAKYNSSEIARSLATSETYLQKLEKATDQAMDAMQLGYFADLHQYYRNAIEEQRLLQDELIKASPVKSVIVIQAKAIYAEMEKAGRKSIDLNQKMDIKEPVNPQVK